jgi:Flp pilus assembly CpaF family ATPase
LLLRVSIAKAGEDASRWPEFTKPELTIGRRSTNDIILPSDGVSGAHARLLVTGRTLTLVDLGSTNGTFVAGERVVGPRPVGPHEEVLIGDFRLTFALVDPSVSDDAGWRGEAPRLPLSPAFGWDDDAGLPPPPPLLDDSPMMGVTPPAVNEPPPRAPPPSPTMISPASIAASRAQPDVPGMGVGVGVGAGEEILSLDPSGAVPALEQAFAAVWSRVGADVVAATPNVERRIHRLLDQALAQVARLGGVPADARTRLTGEMVGPSLLQALLVGDPDEVHVVGTQGVRVDRGGHVTTGPSPFSCATAVIALGSRLCGLLLDDERPIASRAHGNYLVQAIHGSVAGGVATLALRRIAPRVPTTLEELEVAGGVASPHAEILRAAVRAGLRIVVAVGPGASARPVLAALLAAAPSTELQVVVAPVGADGRGLRAGTVLLTRERPGPELLDAALRLHPSRIAFEELPWNDAAALDVLSSSSLRVVVCLRAATAPVGVQILLGMLEARGHGPAPARALLATGVDLVVTVVAGRDGAPRITSLGELFLHPNGELEPRLVSAFDPERTTWSPFPATSARLDDLVHRGLLDPRVLEPRESSETFQ